MGEAQVHLAPGQDSLMLERGNSGVLGSRCPPPGPLPVVILLFCVQVLELPNVCVPVYFGCPGEASDSQF